MCTAVVALLALVASSKETLENNWRVCRSVGNQPCAASASWDSPALPTTALLALLSNATAEDRTLFKTKPLLRYGEQIIDAYYSRNLLSIRDISETGPEFYTLRYEKSMQLQEKSILELAGANYRVKVYAGDVEIPCLDGFGGMFSRRRFEFNIKAGFITVGIVVYPPDHYGSPTCAADVTEPCGQGGDHSLAMDVTSQFVLGWDWMQAIPDRSTGFYGPITITPTESGLLLANTAVLTTSLACIQSRDCASTKRSDATFTAVAEARNLGPGKVEGLLEVSIPGLSSYLEFTLAPGEIKELRIEQLKVSNVELWWPRGFVDNEDLATLHEARFVLSKSHVHVAHKDPATATDVIVENVMFGARVFESYIDTQTQGRAFKVNGERIFLVGGNWITPDAMWRYSANKDRYEAELTLHAAAGLNLIRVWGGGVAESDMLYKVADALGFLVYQELWMTGDNNGRWAGDYSWPLDHDAYEVALVDTIKRLRKYASLLWYGGGNELYPIESNPPPRLWKALTDALATYDPLKFALRSTMDGGVLGGNDSMHSSSYALVAKDGPYSLLLPREWDRYNPGMQDNVTVSLQPEIGSCSAPRSRRSLLKFLTPREVDEGYPTITDEVGDAWVTHRYESFLSIVNETYTYDHARAYGDINDVETWLTYATLVQYQQYNFLFESFSNRAFRWYSGVLLWKSQTPWPSLRGFLYDWYLEPTGGFFGARAANAITQRVALCPYTRTFVLVNRRVTPWQVAGTELRYDCYALNGKWIRGEAHTLDDTIPSLAGSSSREVPLINLPLMTGKGSIGTEDEDDTYFIRVQRDGIVDAWYWLSQDTETPRYYTLGKAYKRKSAIFDVSASCLLDQGAIIVDVSIAVHPSSPELLFYPELALYHTDEVEDRDAWPLSYGGDTAIVLLPNTTSVRSLRAKAVDTGCASGAESTIKLVVMALNAPSVERVLVCEG